MITEVELDRTLRTWLAQGDDEAPSEAVAAAIAAAADVRQRPSLARVRSELGARLPAGRWLLVGVLLAVALALGIAAVGGTIRVSPATPAEDETAPSPVNLRQPEGVGLPVSEFRLAGGLVTLSLPSTWRRSTSAPDMFTVASQQMIVRVGDLDGRIAPCDSPAGPWEHCQPVVVHDLEQLVAAARFGPEADHGVRPNAADEERITIDGEPGVLIRVEGYEFPARGGQEVVHIATWHDGRPYVIRLWTGSAHIGRIDEVVSGFAFGQ
jgi:hypothetical protein